MIKGSLGGVCVCSLTGTCVACISAVLQAVCVKSILAVSRAAYVASLSAVLLGVREAPMRTVLTIGYEVSIAFVMVYRSGVYTVRLTILQVARAE
jgi:hypothetical protein